MEEIFARHGKVMKVYVMAGRWRQGRSANDCNLHKYSKWRLPAHKPTFFGFWCAIIECFQVGNGVRRIWIALKIAYFAPAGSLQRESMIFPSIWKVQIPNLLILDSKSMIFLDFHAEYSNFLGCCVYPPLWQQCPPLQPISEPRSIGIVYPCKWRRAMSASLMQVEQFNALQSQNV